MPLVVIRHCARSEAISRLPTDYLIAALLAMTVTHELWNRSQE